MALDDGLLSPDGSPPASYREQAVEIALGPNPSFRNGQVAALTHRVPPGQVVNAIPPSRRKARRRRPPRPASPPRIVETLRKAIEWRHHLDAGEIPNQAAIARREGITRARVTQVLTLLRLSAAIQEHILHMPQTDHRTTITERALRPIAQIHDHCQQLKRFLDRRNVWSDQNMRPISESAVARSNRSRGSPK